MVGQSLVQPVFVSVGLSPLSSLQRIHGTHGGGLFFAAAVDERLDVMLALTALDSSVLQSDAHHAGSVSRNEVT